MSKNKKEKINIVSIPEDVTTTFTVGGVFYQRLNKLLMDYAESVDKNKLIHCMSMIQRDKVKPTDDFTFNLETLIILLRDLELSFKESGGTIDNEVEVDVPEDFKEMNAFAEQFKDLTKKS